MRERWRGREEWGWGKEEAKKKEDSFITVLSQLYHFLTYLFHLYPSFITSSSPGLHHSFISPMLQSVSDADPSFGVVNPAGHG